MKKISYYVFFLCAVSMAQVSYSVSRQSQQSKQEVERKIMQGQTMTPDVISDSVMRESQQKTWQQEQLAWQEEQLMVMHRVEAALRDRMISSSEPQKEDFSKLKECVTKRIELLVKKGDVMKARDNLFQQYVDQKKEFLSELDQTALRVKSLLNHQENLEDYMDVEISTPYGMGKEHVREKKRLEREGERMRERMREVDSLMIEREKKIKEKREKDNQWAEEIQSTDKTMRSLQDQINEIDEKIMSLPQSDIMDPIYMLIRVRQAAVQSVQNDVRNNPMRGGVINQSSFAVGQHMMGQSHIPLGQGQMLMGQNYGLVSQAAVQSDDMKNSLTRGGVINQNSSAMDGRMMGQHYTNLGKSQNILRQSALMPVRQNNPMLVGPNNPMLVGKNNPMWVGKNNPMWVGKNNPMLVRQNNPMLVRQNNPMLMGQNNPMLVRQNNPMLMGQNNPMWVGQHMMRYSKDEREESMGRYEDQPKIQKDDKGSASMMMPGLNNPMLNQRMINQNSFVMSQNMMGQSHIPLGQSQMPMAQGYSTMNQQCINDTVPQQREAALNTQYQGFTKEREEQMRRQSNLKREQ